MRLIFLILLLSAFPLAAETTVPALPEGSPTWLSFVWPVIFTIVVPYVVKLLNRLSSEAEARADVAQIDATNKLAVARNEFLDKRLIPFLYGTVADLVESRLPALLKDATDGNGFDWKQHLIEIKDEVKNLAMQKFAKEGINIVESVGTEYLDSLLERVTNKALPFLPQIMQDPAAKLIADQPIAEAVVEKGVSFVREKWLRS